MSKNVVPCGGFELGDNLEIKDGKLDLADGAGGGLPTGGEPYQQLCIGNDGLVMWETITLPVRFVETDASSSTTIQCNFGYEELKRRLEKLDFGIMNGQLYIAQAKSLFTMVECIQKTNWLEFLFVVPQDAGDGLTIGAIQTVYYLEDGTITFTRPVA